MSVDFKLPELGENIAQGDIVNVLVKEGDVLQGNQGVIELETEKAVIEIPCPHAGRVTKVHVKKGDTVKVGQPVLTVEAQSAAKASSKAPPAKTAAEEPSAAQQPPVAEEAAAIRATMREPLAETRTAAQAPARAPATPTMQRPDGGILPAGPAARRIARELGVDLHQVQGSGRRGRITPEDVEAAAHATPAKAAAPAKSAAPAARAPAPPVVPPGEPGRDSWGAVRRDKISQIRRTIAAQMARSSSTIPHVTNFDDADVTDLEQVRKNVPPGFLGPNVKLTMLPLVMKAVAMALKRHPAINASLDDENQQIVYKEYVNLGVAVDTPRGLVVPVVRDADRLSIGQLAQALAAMAEKARAAKFTVEELRGGTFTISNLGSVGGAYSTPIINWPEVAILLPGRARWLPSIRDGKVEPRYMLPLSLSYDHRLVDGATAARFLNEVIDYLQSPGKLLLAG